MSFYSGTPENGGELVGTVATSRALEPGTYQDLSLQWNNPPSGAASVHVRIDDDGTGTGILNDADPENNLVFSEMAACHSSLSATEGVSGRIVDAATGSYMPGTAVVLHENENGEPGTEVARTTAGESGEFYFQEPSPGAYILVADATGYISGEREVDAVSGEPSTGCDIALSPVLDPEQIRIVLTWGEHPEDLEAHLTAPNADGCRHHCFYWDPEIPGASLDVDDMRSFGPETVTISQRNPGSYRFYVHDFTSSNSEDSMALANSGAKVTVYSGSGDEPAVFAPPSEAGTLWHVFNLEGADGTIVQVGKMANRKHPGRIDFPKILSSPSKTATFGQPYSYRIEADDPDLDNLVFSIAKGPEGMELDPFDGLLRWTPGSGQGGRHHVEIRVEDGRCGEDTQVFEVNTTYMPAVEFSVEPSSGMNPGGEIELAWRTERADTAMID